MLPRRVLGTLLVVALSACAAGPSIGTGGTARVTSTTITAGNASAEAFCDAVIPLLSKDDIGDDPAALRSQMIELRERVSLLPTVTEEAELVALIDPLVEQLDLAVLGQAESGWSSAEVVDNVGAVCERDDLIGWIIQP